MKLGQWGTFKIKIKIFVKWGTFKIAIQSRDFNFLRLNYDFNWPIHDLKINLWLQPNGNFFF